ncbi:MAG: hypothetical protein EOO09_13660 [Chitinophagaceae bacterium]|nr:MAG: hypothetical protein EOO09_13660 [Chitinophagaceae bacterium]
MHKISLRFLPLFIVCAMFQFSCNSQGSSGITGVWCGVELMPSPLMGGGMDRNDITLYIRSDGTFSDEMDKPDWKTRVDGKYTVSGSKLFLDYGKKSLNREITINSNNTLKMATGYVLRKMDTRKIPVGTYKFQYASGSGGGVSGVPYVGASGGKNIYFDGKGNFHEDGYGTVMVSGDNIGGGSSRNNNASGTYSQKDATLTLSYASGKTEEHSLFIGDDREGIMVVMNGDLFFRESEKDVTEKEVKGNASAGKRERDSDTKSGKLPEISAAELAAKVKAKHGGAAIDKINTLKMTGKVSGMEVVVFTDQSRGWSRTEFRQGSKLVGVEQVEGNSGWTWARGKKSALGAARIKEISDGLNTGFNILKASQISKLGSGTVSQSDGAYVLTYKVDGTDFGMMIDPEYRVVGEGRKINGEMAIVLFSDFRETSGLLVPFTEKMTQGKTGTSVQVTDVSINSVTDADWKEPA